MSTLTNSSSYFKGMFEFGGYECDENGFIFIDRCPKLFEIILHCFRTCARPAQHIILSKKHVLLDECDFYGADWLKRKIEGKLNYFDLKFCDRCIALDEIEGNVALLDVFETRIPNKVATDLDIPLLLHNKTSRFQLRCSSIDGFIARMDTMSNGLLSQLIGTVDCGGIVCAGGSVLAALSGSDCATDIDLFLVCDHTEGETKLRIIYEACREIHKRRAVIDTSSQSKMLLVTRTPSSVTILISGVPRTRPVQIILHTYESISQILIGFDVDCCCVAFDLQSRRLCMTPRCCRAMVLI